MNKQQAQLVQGLRKLSQTHATIIPATVIATDEKAGVVDVQLATGLNIANVRLRSVAGTHDGIAAIPPEGSSVLIGRINGSDDYVVISTEKIEKIKYNADKKYMEFDKDGLLVGNGNDTLKKCLDDLLDEIVKIYAPMNKAAFVAIKDRLSKLIK
ncbi:hypothetical protein HGH92_21630 [Chitinophaga varians]|uniref:Uncharacterized protein n=1 Tax=Chitinophaga varians TaxID=2202339 RepID=A0A847RY43_9BACT|nr:hypothetical protein [Chitinophaga varians]NLR66924.1 hypothetical protein [Chitinophaga varians]